MSAIELPDGWERLPDDEVGPRIASVSQSIEMTYEGLILLSDDDEQSMCIVSGVLRAYFALLDAAKPIRKPEIDPDIRGIDIGLRGMEASIEKLGVACHGDLVFDAQIDALATAVARQADLVALLARLVRSSLVGGGQ